MTRAELARKIEVFVDIVRADAEAGHETPEVTFDGLATACREWDARALEMIRVQR